MASQITMPHARSIAGQVHLTWYKSTPRFTADSQAGKSDQPWFVRVHRQVEPAFVRGEDYNEYFMLAKLTAGEVVFEGELMPTNGRKFTWVDTSADFQTTYSYYIEVEGDDTPVGPVPIRHADPEVYWSYDRLLEELSQLVERYGSSVPMELDHCGQTGAGRAIPRLRIGQRGPRLALVGLIHPGEAGPELIVGALAQILKRAPELFEHTQILALPAVNIDARELQAQGVPWYIRRTITGVDLNRNFPADWDTPALGYGLDSRDPDALTYRGPEPASAAETQAVMAAMEASPPDVVISYHAVASLCSLPALFPVKAKDDANYVAKCLAVGETFAAGGFADKPFDSRWVRPGCTEGSLPLWVYQRFNVPSLDLEMGATDTKEVKLAREDRVTRELVATYQGKHADALQSVLGMLAQQPVV